MTGFKLVTNLTPKGDQPKAIKQLVEGLKKGYRFQTLVGVTGSGKSLPPEERVLVGIERDGNIVPKLVPIGELVEQVFSEALPIRTIEGDEIVFADQLSQRYLAYAFDPVTKKIGWRPVIAFHRHPAPKTLFRVRTSCGREVTVTKDHNFWVMRDGQMTLLPTTNLRLGDWIPLPLSLPKSSKPLLRFPTAQILSESKVYAAIHAKHLSKLALHREKRWRVQNRGEGIPLSLLRENLWAQSILKGRKHHLPAIIRLTNDWLNLFGIYIAEGHSSKRYVTISVRDGVLQSNLKRSLAKLGFTFSCRPDGDIQISSSLLARLLAKLCGRTAHEKRLPPFWVNLSDKQLGRLLSAYFDGDGGVEKWKICCSTVSKQLADDLLWALMRLGIWARVRLRKVRRPKGEFSQCWIVEISGRENLERFASAIGFHCPEKAGKLRALLRQLRQVPSNTNVDIIPISGKNFQNLRSKLGLTQAELARKVGVSPSFISLIEHSKRYPSRSVWRRVVQALGIYLADEHPASPIIRHWQSLLNCRWTRIVAVEPVEPQSPWVYDLSVDTWETFLAGFGGVFVHNTFTIANVIAQWNKPTLIICHNKTLAAQLCAELRQLFPHNAVEYFVSFYDYYQPEAYIPQTDTYIEKDCDINDEIDRLRHAATQAVSTRRDVIVVATVSCIYGLGSPELYQEMTLTLERGKSYDLRWVLHKLVDLYFARNDYELERGTFRLRGDVLEVRPAYEEMVYRIEFFGDEVDNITVIDPLTGEVMERKDAVVIYPASHYVCTRERLERALKSIEQELKEQLEKFRREGKLLEAQRLEQRVRYDLELLRETGYCKGIENYSRHFDGRKPGEPPYTLIDYFPKDFLLIIDESHQTVPQLRAMYEGEMSRKRNLVEFGWRLPSAYDHRPLKFEEFLERINQCIFMSATPGEWELSVSQQVVEQIVRPTGLLDPEVEVRPTKGQIEDLIGEIKKRVEKGQRVLVTTLTKRTAEDLTAFLTELGIKAHYLHHDIEAIERTEILRDLRLGNYDVLVGINLLREGLDLPEVSLVAILDADKEGFLRSYTSLIQIMGRAARHVEGKVIMYADTITESMRKAIEETNRRRRIQEEFNRKHGIKPQSVQKPVVDAYLPVPSLMERRAAYQVGTGDAGRGTGEIPSLDEIPFVIKRLEKEMHEAAKRLEFERAAELRDQIRYLRSILYGETPVNGEHATQPPTSAKRKRLKRT